MVQSSTVSRRPLCRGCIGWQRVCMGRTRLSWCSLTSDFIMSVRLCNTMSCQTDNCKSVNIFRSNAEIMLYCTIHYASNLVRLQAGGGYPLQQRSTYSTVLHSFAYAKNKVSYCKQVGRQHSSRSNGGSRTQFVSSGVPPSGLGA